VVDAGAIYRVEGCRRHGAQHSLCHVSFSDIAGPVVDVDTGEVARGSFWEWVTVVRTRKHISVRSEWFEPFIYS
jgi:hypothetical protein